MCSPANGRFRSSWTASTTGISQPDIGALFAKLAASTSYEEFTALVRQAQGSAGLFRFWHLDDDHVLALDPQARTRPGAAWSG